MEKIFSISETLIGVCIVCSVFSMLFAKTKFHGSLNFVCSVIVLLYLTNAFMPFYTAIGELISVAPDNEQTGTEPNITFEEHIKTTSRGICEYVKKLTANRFELNEDNVTVSVTVNTDNPENIVLKNITVALPKSAEDIASEISAYIGDAVGCPCTVILK